MTTETSQINEVHPTGNNVIPSIEATPKRSDQTDTTVAREETNEQQYIHAGTYGDPFYTLLPEPETWHRNLPATFPFGETPFTQAYMSEGISKDLDAS